jgi:hypothetical protein
MPYLIGYQSDKDVWHGLVGRFDREGIEEFAGRLPRMGGGRKA